MYAIMATDEKTGQLALCLRDVSLEGAVRERLLALTDIQRFDAKSIMAATEGQLEQKGTDQLKSVGQTYDGAAVMSVDVWGVQAQFQIQHPEATYVHCYALHCYKIQLTAMS